MSNGWKTYLLDRVAANTRLNKMANGNAVDGGLSNDSKLLKQLLKAPSNRLTAIEEESPPNRAVANKSTVKRSRL